MQRASALIAAIAMEAAGFAYKNVCTDESMSAAAQAQLCPSTFHVSRLAFNPLGSGLESEITFVVAPSIPLVSTVAKQHQLHITFPGFGVPESIKKYQNDADKRTMKISGSNHVEITEDPLTAYNSEENPLLDSTAIFYKQFQRLELTILPGKTIDTVDTEFRICCFILPKSLNSDSNGITVASRVGLEDTILPQRIKNLPSIERKNYWLFSRIMFDPPTSGAKARVSIIVQIADAISNEVRLVAFLPTLTRVKDESGVLEFDSKGTDWLLFLHRAFWNKTEHSMTFYLRPGVTLESGKEIHFRTPSEEFLLPLESEPNWQGFELEGRSSDGVDVVIPRSPFHQSDHIPRSQAFTYSKLSYSNSHALQFSDVTAEFRTISPSFKGSQIFFRLAGFSTQVAEISLAGPYQDHFIGRKGQFDIPKNVLTLTVAKTLYSNEETITVMFTNLQLPPAAYKNDMSLLLWSSGVDAKKQAIQISPEVIDPIHGPKKFLQSEIVFGSAVPMPNVPSNVTVYLQATVSFYQGDTILLHLYGFQCAISDFALDGEDAHYFEKGMANWNATTSIMTLRVAEGKLLSRTRTTTISIPGERINFRLPDKLSENDGILMIESLGAYIAKEPFQKSPALGLEKKVTNSSLIFVPCSTCKNTLSENVAKVYFSFVVNSDILSNSTIYFKLGGFSRAPLEHCCSTLRNCNKWCPEASGYVRLSGKNAPMFRNSMGYWDSRRQVLAVQMLAEGKIPAGQKTLFFLEEDQKFYLPFALEENDHSLFMYIPEAGISKHFFDFTTRVNRLAKEFIVSELRYGASGSVAYPYSNMQIWIFFRTNVDLPEGTIVRIHLPGFRSAHEQVPLKATVDYDLQAATYKSFKYDQELEIWYATWSQTTQTLDLEVDEGRYISKDVLMEVRLPKVEAGFTLPGGLQPNDPNLQIEAVNNQIIAREPIKKSPLVVDRTFNTSRFVYSPNESGGNFLFKMTLTPTVGIGADHTVFITLPGFSNVLGKTNIHLTGPSASLVQSKARWNKNATTLSFAPFGNLVLQAFEPIDLEVQESQGFVLPSKLRENHPALTIYSLNNIFVEPIKESMMVGDGPDKNQLVCAYQYEAGVRTRSPYCESNRCLTQTIDACSKIELEKCGCHGMQTIDPVPLKISGFQFMPKDTIRFAHLTDTCGSTTKYLDFFDKRNMTSTISADTDIIEFYGMKPTQTGSFRMCFQHKELIKDIGIITVRPVCKSPLVLVENSCVSNCPKTKIPLFGECQRDLILRNTQSDTQQALMVSMVMRNPDAIGYKVWDKYLDAARTEERAERTYFEYRFKYEIARILDAPPKRFSVASISKGPTNRTFYVNVVFKPQSEQDLALGLVLRSPQGLFSLLRALTDDYESILWNTGDFFRFLYSDFDLRAIEVRRCADGQYRTRCPYVPLGKDGSHITRVFFLVVFGIVFLVILVVGLLWRMDYEVQPIETKQKKCWTVTDPNAKIEFARSWVESRYAGVPRRGFTLTKNKTKRNLQPKPEDLVTPFTLLDSLESSPSNCGQK